MRLKLKYNMKKYSILIFICLLFGTVSIISILNSNNNNSNDIDLENGNNRNDNDLIPYRSLISTDNWWNASYKYRAPINITNHFNRNLPKEYSVKLLVNTADLTSNGRLRVDGKDLRIVWFDQSTEDWIELNRVNETNFNILETQIWFKTQSVIRSGESDTTYYLYYGNMNVDVPPTNRNEVYDIFDDFTQPDGDAEDWEVTNGDGWSVVNNEYREIEDQTDRRAILRTFKIKNMCIEVRIKHIGISNVFGGGVIFRYQNDNRYYTAGLGFYGYSVGLGSQNKNDFPVEITGVGTENDLVKDRWYTFKICAMNQQIAVYLDGDEQFIITNDEHTKKGRIGFMTWTDSLDVYFDDLKVRKFLGIEPSLTLGNEETYFPTINEIVENADPLELGNTEIITADVTDIGGVYRVFITFEEQFQWMSHIGGDLWQYDSWIPQSIGDFEYAIYAQNNVLNWVQISGSISVVDTTPPAYYDLVESSDPLELGDTEIIRINVTDISGIYNVSMQVRTVCYAMTHVIGDMWEYDSWIPETVGEYIYRINIEDNNNKIRYVFGNIEVIDTTPPEYTDLIENADPLELGNTEIISISAKDLSGIKQVLIEFEGNNHSMTNIEDDIWQYDSWIPETVGEHSYKIFIEDNNGNYNETNGSIEVIDTTPPEYYDLFENADPLELGETEIIRINVTDISGINRVYIMIENVWYAMTHVIGDMWEYDSWVPETVGEHSYRIFFEDNNNKYRYIDGSIEVIDTTPPEYYDLIENADPLELGNPEVITISVRDFSDIEQVLIEFEGYNHSMTNIEGDRWQYDSWIPETVGEHSYRIFVADNNSNYREIIGSIEVIDTTPPEYYDLVAISDPLELGDTVIIRINVTDISGIKRASIQVESVWYVMTHVIGDMWEYDSWIPETTGEHTIRIYVIDNNDKYRFVYGSFEVIDTTRPEHNDLIENADPLELGNPEIITISVKDLSGIKQVLIEFGGNNHSMTNVEGDMWQYDSWFPENTGINYYTIHMEDNNNNWNYISNSIDVVDTSPPTYANLVESGDPLEWGNNFSITLDIYDFSNMKYVLIEYEGSNHSMVYIGGNKWESVSWKPEEVGNYSYTIYMEDIHNNLIVVIGNFTVIEGSNSNNPVGGGSGGGGGGGSKSNKGSSTEFAIPIVVLFLIILTGTSSAISLVVKNKKSKSKNKAKLVNLPDKIEDKKPTEGELHSLILKREQFEKEASVSAKFGDYVKSADLYKQCSEISSELFKLGDIKEAKNVKYYANLESEAISVDNRLSITNSCINDLMSEFGNEYGIWYYIKPQIYPNSQKCTDGLVLNDKRFLQKRIVILSDGVELGKEIGIDPNEIDHIKALQFKYTNNISDDNIAEIAKKYQGSNTLLFIVGLKWPKYEYSRKMELLQGYKIKYRHNIFVINYELFAELMCLENDYLEKFRKIIELNNENDLVSLNKFHDSNSAVNHDTEDLKDDLIERKYIKNDLIEYFNFFEENG